MQSQSDAIIIRIVITMMMVMMLICLDILHRSAPHGPAKLQKVECVVSRT